MSSLNAAHEQAIDLFVSGKRQHQVAAILKISPRTLRRWSEIPSFIDELKRQHQLARELEQDALAQTAREERDVRKLGRDRIAEILKDPKALPDLIVPCLRVLQKDEHDERRLKQAQEWREFVYFDKLRERQEKADADRKAQVEFQLQWTHERIAKEARKLVIARQDECMIELRVREEAEKAALARGEPPNPNLDDEALPPPVATLTPEMALLFARRAEHDFHYPPNAAENAAKSGQPVCSPGDSPGAPEIQRAEPDKTGQPPMTPTAPANAPCSPGVPHGVTQLIKNLTHAPIVKPVKPFRYPPAETTAKKEAQKADKTGHAA